MELAEKKKKVEEDLKEREEKISLREEEYQSLKDEVEKFPQKLQTSLENAEKILREKLLQESEYKYLLLQKEMEAGVKLYDHKIASLETKILEQKQLIDQLTKDTQKASEKVQNIAIKAVEGALPRKMMDSQENKATYNNH